MKPRYASPLTALSCLIAVSVAQPAKAAWQVFGTTDGLLSNDVLAILEDNSGTYWVPTSSGVSRYDGKTWSRFTAFPNGQHGARVIFQDHLGRFWCEGNVGVLRFDGTSWTDFDIGIAFNNYVTTIIEDHAGNIWVGTTGSGVHRYDGASWVSYGTADGLGSNAIRGIAEDHSGNIWTASWDAGVSRFDGTTWSRYSEPALASFSVNGIAVDHSNNIWFATARGLTRFDGSTWRNFTIADGLPVNYVGSVAEDRFGNIWAGTTGGVGRFDGTRWQAYGIADGIPQGAILDIASDHLGNVWFCINGGGVVRFDGVEWKNYPVDFGRGIDAVSSSLEDSAGNLWFGTNYTGLRFYDGRTWGTIETSSGLPSNQTRGIVEGPDGRIWVATHAGASVREGYYWRTITTPYGTASNDLLSIGADRAGNIWFGGISGELTRFDGTAFQSFPRFTGYDHNQVYTIAEDDSGDVLFGTEWGLYRYDGGVLARYGPLYRGPFDIFKNPSGTLWFAGSELTATRFDGVNWTSFRPATSGQAQYSAYGIAEGGDGTVWLSTFGLGLAMLKGTDWRFFSRADGLANNNTQTVLVDRAGAVWVGCLNGITRYAPDRVAPRTIVTGRPAPLTTARDVLVSFVAAFAETRGIEFSTRFDGQAWSAWGPASSWSASGLADGPHTLEIHSRDHSLNVEAAPVTVAFEVDGTPPAPVLASPTFGQVVRGLVPIIGSSADARLVQRRVAVRPAGATSWDAPPATTLMASSVPVVNGTLATWDTSHSPDGAYDIQVSETDSLGLVGTDVASVIVDNDSPYADQTAPAKVTAAGGGDVFTTNAETHLYFPPHAFAQDAIVMVAALDGTSVPSSLPSGGVKVLDGYELTWAGALRKAARFTMSYAGAALPTGALALYRSADGTNWERLGGTVDANQSSISLAVSLPGRYALFADNGLGVGTASLSAIAFTPRVFSPTGGFADRQLGISFRLGRPAPVTVKVFSASGRFIREVAAGLQLNAGENLIRWDGTDRNGGYVVDGVYFVTVEALGHTETKTLAIVR